MLSYNYAGLFTLALRLVVGWTYFSAFWRRVFLANKLDPESAGYIGEKFNHFLPNALGIKPIIEYLVSNPESLYWAMVSFTIIEGIVGLLFMLGFMTRLMSIGVFSLAMGILLGSGWLGTTCLDEWQIGVLGVAAGFTIFFSGGGPISLDYLLNKQFPQLRTKKWFRLLGYGILPINIRRLRNIVVIGSVGILGLTLFTNQFFHGGVWGTLHNKSVKPKIELSNINLRSHDISFEVFRVEGVDVYGSFLIGISLENPKGETLLMLDAEDLAAFPESNIHNRYVAKVAPGAHSLIVPLGAKAQISISDSRLNELSSGTYTLTLTDISGIQWTGKTTIK